MKKLEIVLRKILLRLLLLLNPNAKKDGSHEYNSESKILFIRLNRIGDALVSTPLLKVVKEKTGSGIFVLADRKNKSAFFNNPYIDELIVFNKGFQGIFEIIRFIKENKIDTVVDLHDDVSTTVSLIISLCGAGNKFALEKWNEKIFTRTVPKPDPEKVHVVERIFALSKLFGVDYAGEDINIVYNPLPESIRKAEDYLKQKFSDDKFTVGINISAGSEARYWGTGNFVRLYEFLKNYDINCLVIAAPDDQAKASEISKDYIYSSSNYDEFAAMISRMDMIFTPDTAAVHLASAFKVPVFGIYVKYKTQDMIWSPYASDFDRIITEEPNLNNVKFEEAINKFKPFLEKHLK